MAEYHARGINTHAIVISVEMIMQARTQPELSDTLLQADLIAADGSENQR
jgi:UDP-N-acetyl-D-mannosaminuronic acid transferase (WecB/TagA/CpsF family)